MIEPMYYGEYTYGNIHSKKEEESKIDEPKKIDESKKEENINVLEKETSLEISSFSLEINVTQYILNPLTVIIKLSILSCKPIGTKIHIQNNVIYFQEPGMFQSIARYIFKSNKSHLQYIYNPIKIACQTYLTKEFLKKTPTIVNLFISAKNGIENLMKTYTTCPMTVLCLKYYHVILSNFIKQTSNEYIFKENDETTEFYTSDVLKKFLEQWNASKLKIVIDLMDFLLKHDINENKTSNIKSLETIIQTIDEDTYKIMCLERCVF